MTDADQTSPDTESVLDRIEQRLNESGPGTMGLLDTIHDVAAIVREARKSGIAPTPDLEKFCIAFAWSYGTELEREHSGKEPEDGMTPETLWTQSDDEERDFIRRIVRNTFAALASPDTSTDRHADKT